MKYIYLTESVTADNAAAPVFDNDAVEQLAFLDVKTFKKLRKTIKAIYGKQAEAKESDQKIVIIYSTPLAVIASGLRSQMEPTQLVAQWCQQAEALVELFKQYQSHCILANLNALKADMKDLVKLVRMNKKERAIFNAISTNTTDADMYTLSAHYMISNEEQLNRQLNILDACTTFNEFTEDTCDIQSILNQQQVKAEQQNTAFKNVELALEQQQAEVTSVNQKLAALSKQMVQEKETAGQAKSQYELEIEQYQNSINQLSLENKNSSEAVKARAIEIEQLQHTNKQLKQENETTVTELHSVQQALETQRKQLQSLNEEKDKLNKALSNAQADLTKQTEENEQIIEQLHLVQEAFEESIIETNKLKTKTNNLEKQIERSESHQTWLVKELLSSHKINSKSWSYRGMLKKQMATIKASGLFDEAWYIEAYPDVAESKMPPILHYLLYGVIEAKNPSPEFNTKNYLSIYFDVAQHGMNPFIHYINFGKAEGRKADPLQKRLPSPKDQ